ncbi:Rrf2 family transcriptional regulator [Streptomyces sp. TRM66268-LWL]|uniref:Rrf2 family transcriptional regulator n=1 Tax=Streptomyces polyasparticus TaxID=2767826 RepID=A0ABR7SHI5_9ACTN|nr:Rrf2 family transcriptional regulator [Streptomyces polyasparticus]MBC9714389.1 Rrf2 family transcriptional regulator [Streptomyces polyasparticus]
MNEGVEWALHSCLNLAWIGEDRAVTAARLAAYHALPTAYLNKQLQALARAGIVTSTPGPKGGFRLARPLERITLMDVVTAIEGPDEAFRCAEIRKQGPGETPHTGHELPCAFAESMAKAELAWRRELAACTLADVRKRAEKRAPGARDTLRRWFENS